MPVPMIRTKAMRNRFMRYTVFLVMVTMITAITLTACGSTKNEEKSDDQTTQTQTAQPQAEDDNYNIDYLVLVNGSNRLPETWEDELQLVTTTNSVGDEVQTEKRAYEAYLKLKEDVEQDELFREKDAHIELDSAFRSVAEQQKIVDDFTEKYGADYARTYAATPGYSEHHTGLALDLYFIVGDKTVYENEDLVQYPELWAVIHKKLPEYGFILRYPEDGAGRTGYAYEPWHIRYVGSPEIAKDITDRGLVLEEYLAEKKGN